jgi:hypothetical protein
MVNDNLQTDVHLHLRQLAKNYVHALYFTRQRVPAVFAAVPGVSGDQQTGGNTANLRRIALPRTILDFWQTLVSPRAC